MTLKDKTLAQYQELLADFGEAALVSGSRIPAFKEALKQGIEEVELVSNISDIDWLAELESDKTALENAKIAFESRRVSKKKGWFS